MNLAVHYVADVHGSRVPALLERAVVHSLEALQRVAAEGTRAGVNTAAVCAPSLRQAFYESFTSFAVAMDKVGLRGCSATHVRHDAA
jgi:hypothetical protein